MPASLAYNNLAGPAAGGVAAVGEDKIRYLVFVSGRWRWRPTRRMRKLGFRLRNFGAVLTADDKAIAVRLNDEWDKVRAGVVPTPAKIYPNGSVGDGYLRAMKMRAAERAKKNIIWTREQESRDDWPRGWKWLEPIFGDVDPRTVEPAHFLSYDEATGELGGLLPKVEAKVSATERHRVVKVWRALWKRMAVEKRPDGAYFCDKDKDPSLTFANSAPDPRQDVWPRHDVYRLVQRAWRRKKYGLAALMAVAWDSMLSPVDARKLTPGQMARDEFGALFFLDRAKTGRAAVGTLTPWAEAILAAYIKTLGFELLDNAPIFRTAGTEPGPRGGRRWLPRPYSKDKVGDDFRPIRMEVFGVNDRRQIADMRRSGAQEADAGGTTDADLANKMANTINASSRLRKTYTPVNVVSVRRVDEARARGSGLLDQRPEKSVMESKKGVS